MPYGLSDNIPMAIQIPDIAAGIGRVQEINNRNTIQQQAIQQGQNEADQAARDRARMQFLNQAMVDSYKSETAPAPSQAPAQQNQSPTYMPSDKALPGAMMDKYASMPAPADAHPAIASITATVPNMHSDTANALDPSNPSFASNHVYTSVDPKTGQKITHTFDREGFLDKLMNYTDDEGNHVLAGEAQKAMDGWTLSDAQTELAKREAAHKANAITLGRIAAFSYLDPSQQVSEYNGLKKQAMAAGVDTSAWPADITSKEGQAWLKNQENQARIDADSSKNVLADSKNRFEKLASDAKARLDASKASESPSVIAKNNAEAAKAWAEAQKAKAEALGGGTEGLTGKDFLDTLSESAQKYLRGVATGTVPINPRSKEGQAAIKAAQQAFPDANISAAQKFSVDLGKVNAGSSGGVQAGANKTFEHIGTMMGADTGKSSGAQFNLGPNWLDFAVNKSINATTSPNAEAAWNAAHTALVTEISRTFKGGAAGENEVVRDMKNLSYADSPDRKARVYQAYADLMQGQVASVENQRRQAYGSADPGTSLLSPKAMGIYKTLKGGKLPEDMLPTTASTGTAPAEIPAGVPSTAPTASTAPQAQTNKPAIKMFGNQKGYLHSDGRYYTEPPAGVR